MRGAVHLFMAACLVCGVAVAAPQKKTKRPATLVVEPVPAPGGVNKADPTMPPPLPGGHGKPVSTAVPQLGGQGQAAALTVRFSASGGRVVMACGRRVRGECLFKGGVPREMREALKPFSAEMADGGRIAKFFRLPPDVYDLVVVDVASGVIYEGMDLLPDENAVMATGGAGDSIQQAVVKGGASAERRRCERVETDGLRGAAILQVMRTGEESKEKGGSSRIGIHFLDAMWLTRASAEGDWLVTGRQRLYWNGQAENRQYKCQHRAELQGIMLGAEPKDIGVVLTSDIKGK